MTTTFPFEAESKDDELKSVGQSEVRIDGLDKISGAAVFVDDMDFGPGLLHAAIVESPHAYAKILSIDTTEAEAAKGVVRVVTGADFPYKFGMYMEDRYIFAQDHVRFVGEQVAGVIARSHREAVQAAKLIKVEYEVLRPLLDPKEAFAEDAELVHPDLGDYTHVPWFFPKADTNIAHWRRIRKGAASGASSARGRQISSMAGQSGLVSAANSSLETSGRSRGTNSEKPVSAEPQSTKRV